MPYRPRDIPIFHKIALSGMVEGQDVVEYGQVIGRATADIPQAAMYTYITSGQRNGDGYEGSQYFGLIGGKTAALACAITFFCCRWMRYRARYAAA